MHELGIVMRIVDMAEKTAEENQVEKVTQLDLEVGEVSTVVPDYFRDCFKWAIKKTKYLQDCVLNIIIIEGKSYCQDCKQTYPTTKYGRTCPYCGSPHTYLVTGRDVVIRDIQAV